MILKYYLVKMGTCDLIVCLNKKIPQTVQVLVLSSEYWLTDSRLKFYLLQSTFEKMNKLKDLTTFIKFNDFYQLWGFFSGAALFIDGHSDQR